MWRLTLATLRAGKYDHRWWIGLLIGMWPDIETHLAGVSPSPWWQWALRGLGLLVASFGKPPVVRAEEPAATIAPLLAMPEPTARRLPKPGAEVPVTSSLDGLAPRFRAALDAVCADVEQATGVRPRVFETLRTQARQSFLYGFGRRYDDGRGVVTHSADADESWHFYGLAADIIHPTLRWSAPASYFAAIGAAAARHGLTWGGDWDGNPRTRNGFTDVPHVQWGRCRRSPSPRARRLHDDGGNAAVWAEVGAA